MFIFFCYYFRNLEAYVQSGAIEVEEGLSKLRPKGLVKQVSTRIDGIASLKQQTKKDKWKWAHKGYIIITF